jgi:hypothetical protein
MQREQSLFGVGAERAASERGSVVSSTASAPHARVLDRRHEWALARLRQGFDLPEDDNATHQVGGSMVLLLFFYPGGEGGHH